MFIEQHHTCRSPSSRNTEHTGSSPLSGWAIWRSRNSLLVVFRSAAGREAPAKLFESHTTVEHCASGTQQMHLTGPPKFLDSPASPTQPVQMLSAQNKFNYLFLSSHPSATNSSRCGKPSLQSWAWKTKKQDLWTTSCVPACFVTPSFTPGAILLSSGMTYRDGMDQKLSQGQEVSVDRHQAWGLLAHWSLGKC